MKPFLAALLLSSFAAPAVAEDVFRSQLTAPIFFATEDAPAVVSMAFTESPESFTAAGGATSTSPFALDAAGAASVSYDILPTEGSLEPPYWIMAADGSISASPDRSITPGAYGPYILQASASGKPSVDSHPFTVTAVRPPFGVVTSPSSMSVVVGQSTASAYSVSNADLGHPQHSVVLQSSGAAAPSWVSVANGSVVANPGSDVIAQLYGPFVVKVSEEGRSAVETASFTIEVRPIEIAFPNPSSWNAGYTGAILTYHYPDRSAAQYNAWTDGKDEPVSTARWQGAFAAVGFTYSVPVSIDHCVFRIGSADGSALPANTQFRIYASVLSGHGPARDITVAPTVSGSKATFSGPCALGANLYYIEFIPLNVPNISIHIFEAAAGKASAS